MNETARSSHGVSQAVILAGGRGTRLGHLTAKLPKPLIEFAGRPFLDHLLDLLAEQGITDVVLLLGYLPNAIMDHVGDGRKYGLRVKYDVLTADDLTATRVGHAAYLLEKTFLLCYCDNYVPIDLEAMWTQYVEAGLPVQVTVSSNEDGSSRNCVRVAAGRVDLYDRERRHAGLNGVEIAFTICDRDVVLGLLPEEQSLFEVAVYPPLAASGLLGAHVIRHKYYSVGDVDRLATTEAFFARHPTVILDRDGTLNRRPPRAEYVRTPEEFVWLPDAREALAWLTQNGIRIIVVSNQAGIGRGAMTEDDLAAITKRMIEDASAAGGHITAFYHCPHGWEDGCDCRKPAPGMLLRAQREFHLDLPRTWFIGDDERDGEAAIAAGARPYVLGPDESLLGVVQHLFHDREKTR